MLFSAPTIPAMHDSVTRLLNIAREATKSDREPIRTLADLGKRIDASPQVRNNWKTRGVSREAAMRAELLFNCSAHYIRTGEGPHWIDPHRATEGGAYALVAREVSHPTYTVVPQYIAWEQLMQRPLGPEFQTVVPDAAMAPDVPQGAVIICVTDAEPRAGDFVLVADATGLVGLREYRVLRPGVREDHAIHHGFLPLRSDDHALRVVAVFDGMRGRRHAR